MDVKKASADRLRSKKEQGGSVSIQGKGSDESGALAVQERMAKANLGGGSIDASVPKPDRGKFAPGLGGEAEYQKAYREYQRKALTPRAAAQKKAISQLGDR